MVYWTVVLLQSISTPLDTVYVIQSGPSTQMWGLSIQEISARLAC